MAPKPKKTYGGMGPPPKKPSSSLQKKEPFIPMSGTMARSLAARKASERYKTGLAEKAAKEAAIAAQNAARRVVQVAPGLTPTQVQPIAGTSQQDQAPQTLQVPIDQNIRVLEARPQQNAVAAAQQMGNVNQNQQDLSPASSSVVNDTSSILPRRVLFSEYELESNKSRPYGPGEKPKKSAIKKARLEETAIVGPTAAELYEIRLQQAMAAAKAKWELAQKLKAETSSTNREEETAKKEEAEKREAAKQELERLEATRNEALRLETVRQEALRREAERQEDERQEAAREEAASRQREAQREAARQNAIREARAQQELQRIRAQIEEAQREKEAAQQLRPTEVIGTRRYSQTSPLRSGTVSALLGATNYGLQAPPERYQLIASSEQQSSKRFLQDRESSLSSSRMTSEKMNVVEKGKESPILKGEDCMRGNPKSISWLLSKKLESDRKTNAVCGDILEKHFKAFKAIQMNAEQNCVRICRKLVAQKEAEIFSVQLEDEDSNLNLYELYGKNPAWPLPGNTSQWINKAEQMRISILRFIYEPKGLNGRLLKCGTELYEMQKVTQKDDFDDDEGEKQFLWTVFPMLKNLTFEIDEDDE